MISYQFKELGATGCKTTNTARQVAAGTVTLVAAPGAGANHIIYQIDWDSSAGPQEIVIGDNAASTGDRIFFDQKGATYGSRVFPQGLLCSANKAISAVFSSSDQVDAWVRITYTTDIRS